MPLEEYTYTNKSDHEIAKRIIYRILTTQARGKDHAITGQSLADRVPVGYSTVRDLIPEIRRDSGLPIGSGNGYWVITSEEEMRRQVERQRRQAENSRQSAREISRAWYQSRGKA